MNFTNSLEVAVGIIIAVFVLWLVHFALVEAPRRARADRKRREFEHFMGHVAKDVVEAIKEAEAESQKPKRRKPATKKAPVKKPVTKKGATNAKTSTRR